MQITPIPCLSDNYAYIISDYRSKTTGVVDPSEAQPVISFLEKAQRDKANINIGIYLLSKDLISFIPESKFISMENDIFPMLVKRGILEAEIREGKFIDIGTPDSLNYARDNIKFFES